MKIQTRERIFLVRDPNDVAVYKIPHSVQVALEFDFNQSREPKTPWQDVQRHTELLDDRKYVLCIRDVGNSMPYQARITTGRCSEILIEKRGGACEERRP